MTCIYWYEFYCCIRLHTHIHSFTLLFAQRRAPRTSSTNRNGCNNKQTSSSLDYEHYYVNWPFEYRWLRLSCNKRESTTLTHRPAATNIFTYDTRSTTRCLAVRPKDDAKWTAKYHLLYHVISAFRFPVIYSLTCCLRFMCVLSQERQYFAK